MSLTRLSVLVTVHPPARKRPAAVSARPLVLVSFNTIKGTAFRASAADVVDADELAVVEFAAPELDAVEFEAAAPLLAGVDATRQAAAASR